MILKPLCALLLLSLPVLGIDLDLPSSQLLQQAQAHLAAGQGPAAIDIYSHVLSRDASDYLTLYKRATAHLVLSQAKKALEDFEAVLRLTEFDQARIQIVRLRLKSGDLEAAKSTLAPYLKANPKDSSALQLAEQLKQADLYLSQAKKYASSNKHEACISNANAAIEIISQSSSLRELRADCHFALKQIEEGAGDLSRAVAMNPSSAPLLLKLSLVNYLILQTDHPLALTPIKQCLHFDPDSKLCKGWFRALKSFEKDLTKARNFIEGGRWASAANLLDPRGKEGLIAEAQELVQKYKEYLPVSEKESQLITTLMGWACKAHLKNGSRMLAVSVCENVLLRDPENVDGLICKGEQLIKKEEWDEAVRVLSDAFEKTGRRDADVHESLQKAQRGLKRSKSKDYYKVLNVSQDADERTIKKAYRKATLKAHPDKGGSEAAMAAVNEAYEVLSNPELRARFDRGDDPNDTSSGHQHPFQQGGSHAFHQFFQQQAGAQHGGSHRFGGGSQQFHFQWG